MHLENEMRDQVVTLGKAVVGHSASQS